MTTPPKIGPGMVVHIAMLAELVDPLRTWLESRGYTLANMPGIDDPLVYIVVPSPVDWPPHPEHR